MEPLKVLVVEMQPLVLAQAQDSQPQEEIKQA
jgi:hypothetical protein